MKSTFAICLFALFALTGCTDDGEEELLTGGNIDIELPLPENKPNEEVDASIFESLNLDYPGLEKVKMHYEAGEHYYASLALLDYYRTRTNVTNPDLSLIDVKATETEMGQANAAMDNYRFYVKGFEDPKAPGMPYSVKKDGCHQLAEQSRRSDG